ncbi:MAG: protein-disulfide reductase DsbD [Steroidobacteraceae bacterium]
MQQSSLITRLMSALLGLFLLIGSVAYAQQSSTGGGLSALLKADDEFLKPDEAFKLSAEATGPDTIEVTWQVAKGYYLYKKRMGFSTDSTQVQLGEARYPKGEIKNDEYFGEQEVYHEDVTVKLPVARPTGEAIQLSLTVKYQGCADAGLCYNPLTKVIDVKLPASNTGTTADGKASNSGSSGGMVSEQDRLAGVIRSGNLLAVLGTFFGLGLLLSFTPCVLPMIPILSGIIVGQSEKVTPSKGFSLAFTYVQGMALTYAAAAVAFVLAFKQAPQAFFQKPWIIGSFAALFVILAFAMFGNFTLQLPSALQTRLTDVSNKQKGGTYAGTFIMGALSALIVTACVAPAMIAALSVISQTGLIGRGAAALYVMGLGMGVPLLLVGASAGTLLPKAGAWMDAVKSLFGVMFLGLAIYLLSSLLPGALTMLLWAALAIISGYWIFSLQLKPGQAAPAAWRGAGLVILIYGVLLLIGAGSGRTDPLQPLQGLASNSSAATNSSEKEVSALPFKRIKSVAELDAEVAAATAAGKTVMLDFYADWCTSCKEMEKYTFTQASVKSALANAVLLQADVTDNNADDQALLQRFGIFGPPTIAFFVNGEERKDYRVVGYVAAEKFAPHVAAAFSKS